MIKDLAILSFAIMGGLIVGWVFTDTVETIHLMIVAGLLGTVFAFALVIGVRSSTDLGGKTSINRGNPDIKSQIDAVKRVNEILDDTEWEQVKVDPSYTKARRKKLVNKKTREFEPHWAILAKMKISKQPVVVVYSSAEDMVVDYDPVPPAFRRADLFEEFEPMELSRMMSRNYDEEKEEKKEEAAKFDFNINDNRKDEDSGGWF